MRAPERNESHTPARIGARQYVLGGDLGPFKKSSCWPSGNDGTASPRQDGINAPRRFFDRCVFDEEKCELLVKALANYYQEYDERTKVLRDAPAHDWSSHFADAFRYMAVGWEEPLDEDWKPEPAVTRFNPYTGQAYG